MLFGLVSQPAIIPQTIDDKGSLSFNEYYNSNQCTFDQFSPNLGCSAFIVPCSNTYLTNYWQNKNIDFPNWLSTINNQIDLRGVYSTCDEITGRYIPTFVFPLDVLNTYSHISQNYVAYTTESIFYAQSGYFVTVVMVQWSNVFACKSRKVPNINILDIFNLFRI